jgi:hypothetical protein
MTSIYAPFARALMENEVEQREYRVSGRDADGNVKVARSRIKAKDKDDAIKQVRDAVAGQGGDPNSLTWEAEER